jgi:hypothetical protein
VIVSVTAGSKMIELVCITIDGAGRPGTALRQTSRLTHASLTHHVRNTLALLALMIRSSCCTAFDGTLGFRFKRSRSRHGRLW